MAQELDLGSVIGPQGPKGETGATGPQGPKGADGKTPTFRIDERGHLIVSYENE